MNKLVAWLGTGTITLAVAACGGKVVVDGPGDSSGGGSSQTTGSGTQQSCGDIVIPSPAELTGCTGGVGSGGGTC
jgi:hypothetical protein